MSVIKFKFSLTGLLNLLEYFERSLQVIAQFNYLHHLSIHLQLNPSAGLREVNFECRVLKTDHATPFSVHWQQWVFTFPVEGKYCPGDRKYSPPDSESDSSWLYYSFVASFSFNAFKMSQL